MQDERWVYAYEIEIKVQSSQCVGKKCPRQKNRQSQSNVQGDAHCFFLFQWCCTFRIFYSIRKQDESCAKTIHGSFAMKSPVL